MLRGHGGWRRRWRGERREPRLRYLTGGHGWGEAVEGQRSQVNLRIELGCGAGRDLLRSERVEQQREADQAHDYRGGVDAGTAQAASWPGGVGGLGRKAFVMLRECASAVPT